MLVVIKYRAKLTYTSQSEVHTDELCDVVHTIDTETLQTLDFEFHPIKGKSNE